MSVVNTPSVIIVTNTLNITILNDPRPEIKENSTCDKCQREKGARERKVNYIVFHSVLFMPN